MPSAYVKVYEEFLNDGDTLKEGTLTKNDNYCIKSKTHQLGLYKINKVSSSCYKDKNIF